MRATPLVLAVSLVTSAVTLGSDILATVEVQQAVEAARKVDMGDYEPVVPWPKPLPDTDLSHNGWTWGSGAGVWAESPNKVWVMQRGEISLPPGAAPWTCACLLTPRRTNTGRRDYSGTPYPYQMRRHHLVFAVDGSGSTIVEWLQHDKYLAPPARHRARRDGPRAPQDSDESVRSAKTHLD